MILGGAASILRAVPQPFDSDIALAHIRACDPRMAVAIQRIGPYRLPVRRGRYAALIRAITGQQVSTAAARSVYERLRREAGGHVSADRVAGLSAVRLRGCGLSRQKVSYVVDLTERVRCGALRLDRMVGLDDEAVIEELVAVRGIGRWTAEMFLIFVLGRPDVLPVDDLGIQKGFERVYSLRKRPGPDRMRALAKPWRPYRTVASWYLWRSTDPTP